MFENILQARLKICEYGKNNKQSYDYALIKISISLAELSKLLVYFIFAVLSFSMWKKHMILIAFWRWWKLL